MFIRVLSLRGIIFSKHGPCTLQRSISSLLTKAQTVPHVSLFRRFSTAEPPIEIKDLRPAPGSRKQKKRVGRGKSRTCGRGNSGQNSRSGGRNRAPGFAGGQTPLHLALPKIGRHMGVRRGSKIILVGLGRLQFLIDHNRLDPSKPITLRELYGAGIKDIPDGVKICAQQKDLLRQPLTIFATRFSALAIRVIEELGGKAIAVYYDRPGVRALTRDKMDHVFELPGKPSDMLYYSDPNWRGYLSEQYHDVFKNTLPELWQRHKIKVLPPPSRRTTVAAEVTAYARQIARDQ